ncbi:Uncharacterised protein [Salmonella enterica subsp. enterica serovar Bovismorbificans]|uniref:Uncharacterized protein n=1 Tax=Salmonella enterica subsp. enterica serovar Bovismorbificans TaxID=58097 RepID=A0A655ENG7_SALET|nr:Uncharacterised protein [Salmonella enterica subsp. enterica serovar Bovismorbificans]
MFAKLVHVVYRIPGALIADSRVFRALTNRAGKRNVFQQRDTSGIGKKLLLKFQGKKDFGLHNQLLVKRLL